MASPFVNPQAPFFHLVAHWKGPSEATVCEVAGAECATETALFRALARALQMPEYFGHNWDALDECLSDLEWLSSRHVVLVFRDAGAVLKDDLDAREVLVEVLATNAEAWADAAMEDLPMSFHVVFQDTAEKLQPWRDLLQTQSVPCS